MAPIQARRPLTSYYVCAYRVEAYGRRAAVESVFFLIIEIHSRPSGYAIGELNTYVRSLYVRSWRNYWNEEKNKIKKRTAAIADNRVRSEVPYQRVHTVVRVWIMQEASHRTIYTRHMEELKKTRRINARQKMRQWVLFITCSLVPTYVNST